MLLLRKVSIFLMILFSCWAKVRCFYDGTISVNIFTAKIKPVVYYINVFTMWFCAQGLILAETTRRHIYDTKFLFTIFYLSNTNIFNLK